MSISDLVNEHERFRNETISLLPSENLVSKEVKRVLGSDLAGRYSLPINAEVHGEYVENAYGGSGISEEIERKTEKLAARVFGCRYADVRPLSGHIAALTVLAVLLKKGDEIMAIDAKDGGYDGYMQNYMPDMLSLKYSPIPFDREKMRVRTEELAEEIERKRPAAVILGSSYIPFPYGLKRIREACGDRTLLLYDGSHVLGLIAGEQFQPDVLKYTDVLYGSTHKSFFGPQGGIILSNREDLMDRIRKRTIWLTLDNTHLNSIAGLGVALEEMEIWAGEYAENVVRNARALARSLAAADFPLLLGPGYTESHQILMDRAGLKSRFGTGFNGLSGRLEKQNIIIDAVGRLGTSEITRIGMKPADMKELAELLVSAAGGENVLESVRGMRKRFSIRYTRQEIK